jgi:hypothetical protein
MMSVRPEVSPITLFVDDNSCNHLVCSHTTSGGAESGLSNYTLQD